MAAYTSPAHEPASSAGISLAVAALALLGAFMGIGLVVGEVDAAFVALGVIAALATFYDFRIGAVLLVVLLPLAQSTLLPRGMFGITGFNPMNLVMLATLASFLFRGRVHPPAGPLASPKLLWLYVVPIVLAGAHGAYYANDIVLDLYELMVIDFNNATGYFRDVVARPLLMVLIAVLIGAALARSKKPEGFLVAIGVAIWIMCYLSISLVARTSLSLSDLSTAGARRFFSGTGLHANDLGRLYAVAYAFLLFAWAESKSTRFRLLCLATMGVVVLALVFTFSRGAFLGFVVVNALFLLWRFNVRTAVLLVVGGLLFLIALPPEVYERLSLGVGQDANAVSAGRIDSIWLPLLPELLNSPLWGSGLSSIMWAEPMHNGLMYVTTHPHNAYLEAYLDLGLIGLALLLAFYWHVWKGFRTLGNNAFLSPEMRGFYKGAAAALVSFFVTGLAGSSLVPRPEYALLWIAIGMMYGQFARGPAR